MNTRKKHTHDSNLSNNNAEEQTKKRKTSKPLSDCYDVVWPGPEHVPTQIPHVVKCETKDNYPFGTTRSGSHQEMKTNSKGMCHKNIKFFKPAALRQEEISTFTNLTTLITF